MRRILFVDDEPKVLEGLQRMLRTMRHEWEMAFADSGSAALERLSAHPFDIVVADIRMPGMDGAQFLSEVRERYPQAVRIVLSGYSDQELNMRSVGTAHQYLAKPCDSESLKQTLQRVCALRELLSNGDLKLLVSQVQSLPVLPQLYLELTRELESLEASMQRIGQIISRDVAMTAKVLQIVNSSFFGLRRHISNPEEAAVFLGLETLRALVLSIHLFSKFKPDQQPNFSQEGLWTHSMQVGQCAKAIAKAEKQSHKSLDEAFTAGLLHEIGTLVLAAQLPQRYSEALAIAEREAIPMVEAERRVFGVAHPEIGAYLLGLWGLPNPIVEAVAFHHEPSGSASQTFTPLTGVHVADHFTHATQATNQDDAKDAPLDQNYLASLGLADHVGVWQEM